MSSVIFHHPSEITPWLHSVISSNREYQLFHVAQQYSASLANTVSFYICSGVFRPSGESAVDRSFHASLYAASTLKSHLKAPSGEKSNIFLLSIEKSYQLRKVINWKKLSIEKSPTFSSYQYVNGQCVWPVVISSGESPPGRRDDTDSDRPTVPTIIRDISEIY